MTLWHLALLVYIILIFLRLLAIEWHNWYNDYRGYGLYQATSCSSHDSMRLTPQEGSSCWYGLLLYDIWQSHLAIIYAYTFRGNYNIMASDKSDLTIMILTKVHSVV